MPLPKQHAPCHPRSRLPRSAEHARPAGDRALCAGASASEGVHRVSDARQAVPVPPRLASECIALAAACARRHPGGRDTTRACRGVVEVLGSRWCCARLASLSAAARMPRRRRPQCFLTMPGRASTTPVWPTRGPATTTPARLMRGGVATTPAWLMAGPASTTVAWVRSSTHRVRRWPVLSRATVARARVRGCSSTPRGWAGRSMVSAEKTSYCATTSISIRPLGRSRTTWASAESTRRPTTVTRASMCPSGAFATWTAASGSMPSRPVR